MADRRKGLITGCKAGHRGWDEIFSPQAPLSFSRISGRQWSLRAWAGVASTFLGNSEVIMPAVRRLSVQG